MRFQQMILAMSVLGVAGAATPAQAAMDSADAMAFCARMTNKDARLECYDQVTRDVAAGRLSSGTSAGAAAPAAGAQPPAQSWAAPPPPQSWSAPPPPGSAPTAGAVAPAGFGSQPLRQDSSAQGPSEIQAAVRSSTDNGIGQWQITLNDGAIWRMTERVSMFRPPAPNETVTIRKGALGGFLMDVGSQASVRVARIR